MESPEPMIWSILEARANQWTERLRVLSSRLKRFSARRGVRITIFGVVLPLFVAALVIAWDQAGLEASHLSLLPILVVVGFVPLGVVVSTWQLHAMARAGGVRVDWWSSFRVVTLSTLSALLPVSSGSVIRGGAVVVWGVPARTAGLVFVFDAILWTSISLIYSGVAAFLLDATMLGLTFASLGLVLIPVSLLLSRSLPGRKGRLELLLARSAGIVVQVVRLTASFLALGYGVTVLETSTLVAASPISSVFFFLPGGIGVREGFISAVAAGIGLSAAGAFLAAALNRLVGLSVLLVWEGILLVIPMRSSDRPRP